MARPDAVALLSRAGLIRDGPGQRLQGGDVSEVWRFGDVVTKRCEGIDGELFFSEARGLRALSETVRVPRVLYVEAGGIVLDYLAPGPVDWDDLAEQVARLHAPVGAVYGHEEVRYCGTVRIEPHTSGSWQEHWSQVLLELVNHPLLRPYSAKLGAFLERPLPTEGPSWVHGDLWSGNVHFGQQGAALIDPSAFLGERAVDLAMMMLFGGFPVPFWEAYERRRPVPPAIWESLAAYELFFLMVHVHLFGRSYLEGVRQRLDG